jgi:hypothetical protein
VGACEMRVECGGLYIPEHGDFATHLGMGTLSTMCSESEVVESGECDFFFQRGRE